MEHMTDNDTVQKKLNLREPYAEALEEAAKEIYGSAYKQARVVEALLDQTRFQPDSGRIEDDLQRNGFGIDPIQRSEQEEEQEEDELEDMSPIEKMNNLKNLDADRGVVVAEFLEERGPPKIELSGIVNVIQDEAGYSQSMSYNIAWEAVEHLRESPFAGEGLDEWAVEKAEEMADHSSANIDGFADFSGIEELPIEVWYTDEEAAARDYRKVLTEITISDVSTPRRKASFEKAVEARPLYVSKNFVEEQRKEL